MKLFSSKLNFFSKNISFLKKKIKFILANSFIKSRLRIETSDRYLFLLVQREKEDSASFWPSVTNRKALWSYFYKECKGKVKNGTRKTLKKAQRFPQEQETDIMILKLNFNSTQIFRDFIKSLWRFYEFISFFNVVKVFLSFLYDFFQKFYWYKLDNIASKNFFIYWDNVKKLSKVR